LVPFFSLFLSNSISQEWNKSQVDSFIDEDDQWQSLDEEEQILITSKYSIIQQMKVVGEDMVLLFMGQKLQDR